MVLQVRNLRCGYGSLEVVRGVSIHVSAGEIVGLLGANGAGKTTLLKAIVGLLAPWDGDVFVQGRSTRGQPGWRGVGNSIVLVPEGRQVFGTLTVRDNLLVGGLHNKSRRNDIEIVLEQFPRLRERSSQLAGRLSGGEQQMLALGRALMARPKVLLLDEPSMGLAPLMVKEVFSEITRLKDLGVTILLVEQNAMAALKIADRAYVMEMGQIAVEGDAADLIEDPEIKDAYLGKGYKEIWE